MRYDELETKCLLVKNMVDKYGIMDILPEKVYQGDFEKIPVWVYWHQGFDQAPDIIKVCLRSIEEHLPYDKVELIKLTRENLNDYVKIPLYVFEDYNNNYTYVSNIIRAALLYNYGGLWIDATYLFLDDLDPAIFEKDFWAIKRDWCDRETGNHLCDFSFNLCYIEKNSEVMKYMYRVLCGYCLYGVPSKYYFIKDGMLVYGYLNDLYPKRYVDEAFTGNKNLAKICSTRILSQRFTNRTLDMLKGDDNSYIFKLTYKGQPLLEKVNDRITIYGYLKQKFLGEEVK